jgi:hypothetical protein
MRDRFDRRVLPEAALAFLAELQREAGGQLGGGMVLSGAWLVHRRSRDMDLFFAERDSVRAALSAAPQVAGRQSLDLRVVRDAGGFVRCVLAMERSPLELDLVHEPLPDLGGGAVVEGLAVRSELDLRASKLTCILSRSEPRDLVDLLFLERAGYAPEADLAAASRKDGGIDPGILAWLLAQFPTSPLPEMLEPLTIEELRGYRDGLAERLRRFAVPG